MAAGVLDVLGGSAGGGLAAAVTLLLRDRGEVAAAFQVLNSPKLDDRQVTRSSQIDGLPIWSREFNAFGGTAETFSADVRAALRQLTGRRNR